MSLASLSDVADRLGRPLTSEETAKADTLLDEASDLVVGYLGCELDPVPGAVSRVVSRMVARVLAQGESGAGVGVTQMGVTAGPFSQNRTFTDGAGSGSPWIEKTDKLKLRPYRCGGGMTSVSMVNHVGH